MLRGHGSSRSDNRVCTHQRRGRQVVSRSLASHPHVPGEKHGFSSLPLTNLGLHAVAVSEKGSDELSALNDDTPTCLVLGDEHQGVSHDVLKHCTSSISIPMQGKTSSLNVGVAAGIVLYAYRS